ncbi:YdbC family protein [Salinithrix halophila]|uniref:YdbC family protein n=2 Tax=Salinithrix halophila TaxID=1485204 RepID=A0ABV8JHS3_9BACL
MLVKWILCDVRREKRTLFSRAQTSWNALRYIEGFLGQVGGWNVNRPWEACVMGFWKDSQSFQRFMIDFHDRIFEGSAQAETYDSIRIALSLKVEEMKGEEKNLYTALRQGEFLRVSDMATRVGGDLNVAKEQREVWNPALSNAQGMLRGIFSRELEHRERYLVTSIWQDESSLQGFHDQQIPRLRERLDYRRDLEQFVSRTVRLNSRWRVLP